MSCESYERRKFVPVEGCEALGDKATELSREGYLVEVEDVDGEVDVHQEPRFLIDAVRLECQCVCQRCGHTNGTEVPASKRKAKK